MGGGDGNGLPFVPVCRSEGQRPAGLDADACVARGASGGDRHIGCRLGGKLHPKGRGARIRCNHPERAGHNADGALLNEDPLAVVVVGAGGRGLQPDGADLINGPGRWRRIGPRRSLDRRIGQPREGTAPACRTIDVIAPEAVRITIRRCVPGEGAIRKSQPAGRRKNVHPQSGIAEQAAKNRVGHVAVGPRGIERSVGHGQPFAAADGLAHRHPVEIPVGLAANPGNARSTSGQIRTPHAHFPGLVVIVDGPAPPAPGEHVSRGIGGIEQTQPVVGVGQTLGIRPKARRTDLAVELPLNGIHHAAAKKCLKVKARLAADKPGAGVARRGKGRMAVSECVVLVQIAPQKFDLRYLKDGQPRHIHPPDGQLHLRGLEPRLIELVVTRLVSPQSLASIVPLVRPSLIRHGIIGVRLPCLKVMPVRNQPAGVRNGHTPE